MCDVMHNEFNCDCNLVVVVAHILVFFKAYERRERNVPAAPLVVTSAIHCSLRSLTSGIEPHARLHRPGDHCQPLYAGVGRIDLEE